jgi:hypothetical protein
MRKGGAGASPFRPSQQVFIPVEAMRMMGWNIIRDLNRTSNIERRTSNFQRPTRRVSHFSLKVECSTLKVRRFL